MHGVLILNKPASWTSHDVVARVRGILQEKSVGHLGTLDPLASGVLPLVVGAATRLAEFADFDKEYEVVALLGRTTDTEDVTGRTLEERPASDLDPDAVRKAVMDLQSITEQVPPMVSAVKQDGTRLYELARQGRTVERHPRPVSIRSVEILGLELPHVSFRVVCSAGTYVRTLCRTLGETLGCGACMESLVRARVGPFSLLSAVTLEELEKRVKQGDTPGDLRNPLVLVERFPEARLGAGTLQKLCSGLAVETVLPAFEWVKVVNEAGSWSAMARSEGGKLSPRKVFGVEGI
jgi:tRNA pseudouridine55 synthase